MASMRRCSLAAGAACSAVLRAVTSLHEPTTSSGLPWASLIRCCSSRPSNRCRRPCGSGIRPLPALFEQLDLLGLDRVEIVRMHVGAPEVRLLQIFARLVAEHALDVVADEGGGEIAARLEAVNHGRRAVQHEREPRLRRVLGRFCVLSRGDVAPRSHDLGGLAVRRRGVKYCSSLTQHIGAVLACGSGTRARMACLFRTARLTSASTRGQIVGVDVTRARNSALLEIFFRGIAEQPLDIAR